MWDTYTSEFKDYFNGLDRASQTELINNGWRMSLNAIIWEDALKISFIMG